MPWTQILFTAQMHDPSGPGLFEMFWSGGPMGKFVLALLLGMSIVSWTIIVGKGVRFRRARRETEEFVEVFRRSTRFSEVNEAASQLTASPLVGLFHAGYVEIDAQVKAGRAAGADQTGYLVKSLSAVERSLRRGLGVELQALSRGTAFLATTAAASPFIGLFGTVWGIMVAFSDIGASGSTSLVAVAPGIAEALINTAAGLFAAIPALVGYNYFGQRIRQARSEMEDFILDLLNLTERNFT
jgi:biopolymer transport protein TolQ